MIISIALLILKHFKDLSTGKYTNYIEGTLAAF